MKLLTCSLALAFAIANATHASPLQKDLVPSDAKWLIHVDLDQFRKTEVGQFVAKEVIEKQIAPQQAELKKSFNFDFDWTKINSLTAFGSDYKMQPDANGVLLIKTSLKPQLILDALLGQQTLVAKDSEGLIKKLSDGPGTTYAIKDNFFVSVLRDDVLMLAKSRPLLDKANKVIEGKSANLSTSEAFAGFPTAPKAFFFLGVAEGFNENMALPPQAKVLQMADGGRLVLGENASKLFLNLMLKTKTTEASQQIQQVLQGLVALATLSQSQNPEVMQLAQSLNVKSEKQFVTLGLEYPVSKVLDQLSAVAKNMPKHIRGAKDSSKTKTKSKAKKEEVENSDKTDEDNK